ncbi:DUF190 domain-containing protein [Moorella sp. Hama-1]|uniref:DUF190 domain-containing protein n=1 Tax=Moorella sp. Hama-1 TaxID=2138101 RepID=UPI000D64942A|nr:DUF190 domain-containing protein [Moorella sp. Hama-1]MDN5362882.1 uncharacterized protein [Moorella sp. (in: firmicutes)]BCV20444.1 hypothetical protein hamaS1_05130 [Moorella sp. Hama-1]
MDSSKAKRLTVYLGEGLKWQGKSLYHALVLELKVAGLAGVTVSRGIEGYGKRRQLYASRLLELSADLPVVVEAVDSPEKINAVLPRVRAMVRQGLITLADVEIIPPAESPTGEGK